MSTEQCTQLLTLMCSLQLINIFISMHGNDVLFFFADSAEWSTPCMYVCVCVCLYAHNIFADSAGCVRVSEGRNCCGHVSSC